LRLQPPRLLGLHALLLVSRLAGLILTATRLRLLRGALLLEDPRSILVGLLRLRRQPPLLVGEPTLLGRRRCTGLRIAELPLLLVDAL
jgi:hypothetical protein